MKYAVGIDLGSTTTKAVVLSEQGTVLGRGITNTRSNYEVACRVALGESLTRARLGIAGGLLARSGVAEERVESHLAAFERAFRKQQYVHQLRLLAETVRPLAAAAGVAIAVRSAVDRVVRRMEADASSLFASGTQRKSDFFRDLAGSAWMSLSEAEARRSSAPFEVLAGLFDKAILTVENTAWEEASFEALARAALADLTGADRRLAEAVESAAREEMVELAGVGTGYGRQRLPFPKERIRSEILCHGLGAHAMFPRTRTVLDIGGQDTKAIQVDENGIVTSFQMNDRCAAGCGRYLGYIADEMNLALHELGPLAASAKRTVRISSTCTVFAGAELRERLSLGEKREDILAGLHRAIVLRAMSLLARSGGVTEEFTFTGGVARNAAATEALRRLIHENYGERTMNVSADSIYTGALGAALFALRGAKEAAGAAA